MASSRRRRTPAGRRPDAMTVRGAAHPGRLRGPESRLRLRIPARAPNLTASPALRRPARPIPARGARRALRGCPTLRVAHPQLPLVRETPSRRGPGSSATRSGGPRLRRPGGSTMARQRGTSPSDSALVPASVRRWLGSRARSSWSGCSPGSGRSNSCPRRAGRRSSVRVSPSVVCARYRCGSASGEHGRAGTRAPHERFSSVSAGLRSVTRRTPRTTTPTTNQPKPRVWAATWALTTT